MILNSACQTCFQRYRILIESRERELIKQIADKKGLTCPCPRSCGGTINLIQDAGIEAVMRGKQFKEPIHLTGTELYKAVNGAGLPDELPKLGMVAPLLLAYKVKNVEVEEIDGQVFLHELVLDNGSTVHLTAGLRGAQVVKITAPLEEKKRWRSGSSRKRSPASSTRSTSSSST